MTRLPAVVEVADFAVEEDFMVALYVLVVSTAVATWPEDLGPRIP
jgi:hypothetical protein